MRIARADDQVADAPEQRLAEVASLRRRKNAVLPVHVKELELRADGMQPGGIHMGVDQLGEKTEVEGHPN
jgi:hypothetical protein